MSQIQISGEAKIRDLQGPVVANSGVITALDGLPSQYVRGDGTLADIPSVTGGGSSVSYYLNGSVNQGTFGGSTYYQLGESAITGVGTNFSTSTDGLLAQFITDIDVPDVTEIPSGNWNIEFYMGVSASSGALASFYVEIYKYDGTTFTLVGSNVTTPEFLTNTTTVDAYFTSVAMPLTAMAETDRIAIRVYANVASKTVTMYTEDNRLCQIVTTFSRGMLSLNSLTDQQQYLTVGTAGTDFNIVSSVDTHTFNIPSASATNRGLITTGSQTIAGAKTFSSTATFNTGGVFNNWGISLYDGAGSTALSSSTLTGIYASKSGSITDIVISHNAPYDSILRFSNDVANFTYTFPDLSGTIALLEGSQTFTGEKVFNNNALFNSVLSVNYGAWLQKGTPTATFSGAFTTLYSEVGAINAVFRDNTNQSKLQFQAASNYTYTFPASSGIVALSSDLDSYVTLATAQTISGNKTFEGDLKTAMVSIANSNTLYTRTGYTTLSTSSVSTTGWLGLSWGNSNSATLAFNNAAQYTYTFPALSGTIALLEGSQTFTGAKTFSASVVNDDGLKIKFGSASNLTANYLTLSAYGLTSPNRTVLRLGTTATTLSELYFSQLSSYQYTFPDASGTLALTSNLSAYLPLAGGILTGPLSGTSATFVASGTYTNFLIGTTSTTGAIIADANRSNLVLGAATSNKIVFNNASTTQNGYIYSDSAELSLGYPASGTFNIQKVGVGNVLSIASTGAATFSSSVTATSGIIDSSSGVALVVNQSNGFGVKIRSSGTGNYGLRVLDYADVNTYFTVNHNGNVGIGTSSPGAIVDINIPNVGNTDLLRFSNSVGGSGDIAKFQYGASGQFVLNLLTNASANRNFGIINGNVGIGTSSPNAGYKLNVNGNTYLIGATSASGSFALIIQNSSLTSLFSVQNDGVVGVNNLAGTGSRAVLADAGGNLSAPVSDISVKQNITTIGYGLNEILKMNPVWFDFIDDYKNYGEGRQNGNIAQEMQEIIPEAVFVTPSTGKMGINYDQLHAVYIKAIQELSSELTELKAFIAAK